MLGRNNGLSVLEKYTKKERQKLKDALDTIEEFKRKEKGQQWTKGRVAKALVSGAIGAGITLAAQKYAPKLNHVACGVTGVRIAELGGINDGRKYILGAASGLACDWAEENAPPAFLLGSTICFGEFTFTTLEEFGDFLRARRAKRAQKTDQTEKA